MDKKKKMKVVGIIFLVIVVFVAISIYISNTNLQTTNYEVKSAKIPKSFDGFKILQLTDLHDKEFGENNEELVEKIDSINPDIIVMTGDMVTSTDSSYEPFYTLTEQLIKKYNIYYIVGNHEQAISADKLGAIKSCITKMADKEKGSMTILDNKSVKISKDGESFNMYGMWFHLKYYVDVKNEQMVKDYKFDGEVMRKILEKPNEDEFNLLLTHNPVYLDVYSDWGADLVLCGHMHGGMIDIPFKGGLFSPEKELFPKYDSGMFKKNNTAMVVGRGLGNGNLGFRWFNCPELSVVTLRSEKK